MRFTKMQGIGNDYVYVYTGTERVENPEALARKISDRHFGVGSDGLVLILPANGDADFEMRMFNADGSEAEMCGNASRCVGKYVHDKGLTDLEVIRLKTKAGIKILHLKVENGRTTGVTVDMGKPVFTPELIPTTLEQTEVRNGEAVVLEQKIQVDETTFTGTCVSMGNPHCVIRVEDADTFDLPFWGPKMERHPVFPRRTNTEFVTIHDRNRIRMRVWERGAGETLACGTGACATLAACFLSGWTDRRAELLLNGGSLNIEWDEKTGHILMTGPAEFVFDGEWPDSE